MEGDILVKYSASECNRNLLTWVYSNKASISKKINLKVVIVYEDLYHLLKNKIKKLPVLIIKNKTFTGNNAIKNKLKEILDIKNNQTTSEDDTLEDFWRKEIQSGGDDEGSDIMGAVKQKAMDMTSNHRQASNNRKIPNRKSPKEDTSSRRVDNINISSITPEKISDLIPDDPMMQKFWENQEESPMG